MDLQELSRRLPERFPYACQWELTCRCNLRCVMCYTDCFNTPEHVRHELSTGEIRRILDELAEAGCVELTFTGGEPLARGDFMEIYEHAASKGFLVSIFTNGTLITERLADRLAETPPFRVEISLHGLHEATFERVTQGRGSHARCLAAITLLRDRRIPLVLKTTAMTVNKHEVLAIKRLADGMPGVRYKLGEEMRPALDGSEAPMAWGLSDAEADDLNRRDPQLWREACARGSAPQQPCRSGMRSCHIDAYGRLQLCSGNRRQGYDLRTGSFRDGFYRHLPAFACAWKDEAAPELIHPERSHA